MTTLTDCSEITNLSANNVTEIMATHRTPKVRVDVRHKFLDPCLHWWNMFHYTMELFRPKLILKLFKVEVLEYFPTKWQPFSPLLTVIHVRLTIK